MYSFEIKETGRLGYCPPVSPDTSRSYGNLGILKGSK